MQSGHEDTLEEWYDIKFWFKLGKDATETYGMLQTAFRASCMNRAWVFEWHKRFKEGRESVRDDERCRRSKEVRTPELIGQIKNLSQGCSEKIRKKDVVMTAGRWSSWSIQIPQFLMLWKHDLLLWLRDQETEFPVEACWLFQTQEGQTEQIHLQTFDDRFFWQHWHNLYALGSH